MIRGPSQNLLAENAEERHKIAVHVVSGTVNHVKDDAEKSPKQCAQVIQDVTVFKSSHGMHALVQPYINITRKGNKSKL